MSKKIILFVVCLLLVGGAFVQAQSKSERPNIIFIFADDWGYGDLSAHGSTWVETPNIDNMIKDGMDFANFTVNSPVCSPSRTAVMTGQFPARQSIHQHFQGWKAHEKRGMPDWMDPKDMSFPKAFQKAGYATAHFGKWHLGSAPDMPKESAYGYDEYATFNGSKNIDIPKAGSVGVDYAEDFIKRHKDQPFFINLWLHEAHTAHYPQERFMNKFGELDEQKQVYASIIAEGDEAVGRISKLLKELGLEENTLVVFSTDNGPEWEGGEDQKQHKKGEEGLGKYYSVGETGGLKGQKRSLFAGGIRVPFVAKWPKVIPKGVKDDTSVVTAVDLLPTFLEAANIPMPKDYKPDGESMMPALTGKGFKRSKPIFWEWKGGTSNDYTWPTLGVRDGDWKLVVDVTGDKYELFNLKADWKETKDLAKSNPEKAQELLGEVKAWKATLPTEPRASCLSAVRK